MTTKRPLLASFSILMALCLAWGGYWYLSSPTPEPFPLGAQPVAIANAGGEVDGYTGTNSQEALERSLRKKFSFIELDLCTTPEEEKIVAAHDWKSFFKMIGMRYEKEYFSYAAIADKKIQGKFSLLTAEAINFFFLKNDTTWLVTGRIRDFDILLDQIAVPSERMLVETSSYKQYKRALREGIRYPMLCIWNKESLYKNYLQLYTGKVKIITIPVDLLQKEPALIERLYTSGVTVFAFVANDSAFVKEHLNKRVTGFYTDTLSPDAFSLEQ